MKIGSNEPKGPVGPASAERAAPVGPDGKPRVGTSAAAAAGVEPSATVELSPAAASLASGAADPTFDAAKVDRIAQAIRDGSYQINAEAIADKLIANAQELLGKVQR